MHIQDKIYWVKLLYYKNYNLILNLKIISEVLRDLKFLKQHEELGKDQNTKNISQQEFKKVLHPNMNRTTTLENELNVWQWYYTNSAVFPYRAQKFKNNTVVYY